MKTVVKIVLVAVLALASAAPLSAQRYRGDRRVIRGGLMPKPDSLRNDAPAGTSLFSGADSLRQDSAALAASDSLRGSDMALASLYRNRPDSLRTGSMADSLLWFACAETKFDFNRLLPDSLPVLDVVIEAEMADSLKKKREPFFSDSMSLSKVCWLSAALPGFGQIYNKQYWKLPILYSTLGTSLGMFIYENGRYKPLKKQYDELTNQGLNRTPELNRVQTNMIRSNTRRELYLGAAVVSYLYFIGDAAVKYSTNDVSSVKRATTLAMICPGAGQIYNKSYWRVPIVLGGFATTIYCIDWNNRGYQRFKKAYRLRADYDDNPDNYPDGSTDEFGGRYSASFLKNLRDNYRRNRDLCIILTAGLYILQIVDAHVDAHLRDYDISDDLSMNVSPTVDYIYSPSAGSTMPAFGMNLSINF